MTALFFAMFAITTLNVIMRFCFNSPITFAVELGRYCFCAIIYLGAIYVMRDNGHIGLDIFVNLFPPKLYRIADIGGRILVLLFLIVFSYESIRMTAMSFHIKSSAMQIPMSVPYSMMVIGGIGMAIEQAIHIVNRIKTPVYAPTEEDLVE